MFDSFRNDGSKELEIIVDSCSAGANVYEGLSSLIDYAKHFRDNFEGSRIVMPIQIGTEMRQRIFPEFLHAELMEEPKKENDTRDFYQKHHDITQLVETNASRAYKMFFAFRAAELLENDPRLRGAVLKEAQSLARRYTPDDISDDKALTQKALSSFIEEIGKSQALYNERWAAAEEPIKSHNAAFRKGSEPSAAQTSTQETLLVAEQRKIMARVSKDLLSFTPEKPHDLTKRTRRFLLQSMYSCNELYREVAEDKGFKSIRRNHGERAIEQFLFDRKEIKDPQPVSLVISNDYKAHPSMRGLHQRKGQNPFFVMGNDGLGRALGQLTPNDELLSMLTPGQQETAQAMHKASEKLSATEATHVPGKLEEDIASANHFANYMVTGKIKPPTQERGQGIT